MSSHQPHRHVRVKVTAYVDERMKELVELPNAFDGVSTFESCQVSRGQLAYACMNYGDGGPGSPSAAPEADPKRVHHVRVVGGAGAVSELLQGRFR